MQLSVRFNNKEYDPFIDFLKGICIIGVVLTHSIPYQWQQLIGFPFWGAQAVPIFLLIQSFHYFKRDTPPQVSWRKLWNRIVLPFIVFQLFVLSYIVVAYFCGSGMLTTPLKEMFLYGGRGPGSYYFWIYLQFALILLPIFGWIERRIKLSIWGWGIVFVLLSEVLELLCSLTHIIPEIYRLLAIRYIFLIYGGYVWARIGIRCNWWTILLSLTSIVAIVLLQYKNLTMEPWIFDTDWRYFHWFCYFYAIWMLAMITNVTFHFTGGGIRRILLSAGKYSYQIFIFQLLVFEFFPENMNQWVYMLITTILCIAPILCFYMIKEKWQTTNI